MKRVISFSLILVILFSFTACGRKETSMESIEVKNNEILVVYFSCTNNTKNIAEYIRDITNADNTEIIPSVPYTSDDLNYSASECRAGLEHNDDAARPAISNSISNMNQYKLIFLGYPIWYGEAPKIIYTFLESYDFTGITIIPFCTSGSSGIGSSDDNLHTLAPSAIWVSGKRFAKNASKSTVSEWIDGLAINQIA